MQTADCTLWNLAKDFNVVLSEKFLWNEYRIEKVTV